MGAFGNFLVLIVIGAGIGFAMTRYGHSVAGRPMAHAVSAGEITYALVGIAGAFMGFHIGIILDLLYQFVLYVLAAIGAALTIWIWRSR